MTNKTQPGFPYIYNITQTLKPFYHKYSIHKQYFGILPQYKKTLDFLYVTHAIIAVELTQAGNIHFHAQITSILPEDEFIQTYTILTKSLGFSNLKLANSQQSQQTYLQYMQKDILNTVKMFNTLSQLTRKDLPKKFKEFTPKHIYFTIEKPIENIISHYNNIQCPPSNEQLSAHAEQNPSLDIPLEDPLPTLLNELIKGYSS